MAQTETPGRESAGARRAFECWVVTDGRAGNENPALGLAEAAARLAPFHIAVKRFRLKEPWGTLPPALWGDPFTRLSPDAALLRPPFPDLWIGCGRLSAPFGVAVKKRHPASFTVQLLRPPAPGAFDLVIAPLHDGMKGKNVVAITGSLSRATPERLASDAARLGAALADLPSPRVAVLLGGPNRAFAFGEKRAADIAASLSALAGKGAGVMITASRRTPERVKAIIAAALETSPHFFWNGAAVAGLDNPYFGVLGLADHVLVTEDSVNMASEAAITGKPVHVLALDKKAFARGAAKFARFHAALAERGVERPFRGALEAWRYPPLDETARAGEALMRRFMTHKARPPAG